MNSFNNSKNVVGMGSILTEDGVDDISIDEIEKSIMFGVQSKPKEKQIDIPKDFSRELESISQRLNITNNSPLTTQVGDEDVSDVDDIDTLLNLSNKKPTNISYNQSQPTPLSTKSPYNLVDDDSDADNDEFSPPADKSNYYESSDPQLKRMTKEEVLQTHVDNVMGTIGKNNDDAEFIQKEDEEDEMARIMEQIDLLRSNLESEGVDLSRIPDVNSSTNKKEAKAVLRILQIKNDRLRYCDFFEEGILAVAYGLEGVFNGHREVLGSKIDLTGYSDTVKVKLRRMRYDTSSFVSGIMQGYNINSGWRIVLELIPSLFLYSRDRRLTSRDNLISDDSYRKAMQDLQGS